MTKIRIALWTMCAALPLGCGDDNTARPDAAMADAPPDTPSTACTVTPGAWSAPDFATNAAAALALRAQIDTLTGVATMQGAEQGTATVDEVADLEAVYNGGLPVLSSVVPTALDAVIDDAFAEFVPIVAAGLVDLIDGTGWNPGTDGGLYSTTRRAGFNTGAIEVRQIVDKGLFVGAMFNHALKLTEGTIHEGKIDGIAAAWGGSADMATRTDSANYSFEMGFAATMVKNLSDAKAYAADPDCTSERDAALEAFFHNWEKSMFARVVHYANKGPAGIPSVATDDGFATALHEVAEGLGLAVGFYGVPNPASGPFMTGVRTMTDADIDAVLTSLGVNRTNLAASTMGPTYVDMALGGNSTPWADGVVAAETKLKNVLGFSDADITAYRTGNLDM
jgi:hypothetical protein